jgi:type I restriction enzyme R subunit
MPIGTEADRCRKYVLPKLYASGWTDDQMSEVRTFTDGCIVVIGDRLIRRAQKRADYLLRYSRDFALENRETGDSRDVSGFVRL